MNLNWTADKGLFPFADYLTGVDLAIGGCGYNFFFETALFGISCLYFPQQRTGDEQGWRFDHSRDVRPAGNGADRIAREAAEVLGL